ncbi:MAG: hypothetical protein QF864_04305 [SAR202 cluster bacterium]|jgi:hypothetical protein|nr:hypothetical protein [SAR202 cluster bacterium]
MKFNPNDVHIVIIGNDRILDYRLNLEILRYNMSFGDKLWITTVFNGEPNGLPSGIGENTFLYIKENRGYGLGALDAFNEGLSYAKIGYRPIVIIMNFDVWLLSEKGLVDFVEDFMESCKDFGAGLLPDHGLPMTDCMIFKRQYLEKLLPIKTKAIETRAQSPKLQKMYEGTELGFANMEEWMYNSLVRSKDTKGTYSVQLGCNDIWWQFQRDGAPRYRWTEKYTLTHEHDYKVQRSLLKKYNATKGNIIQHFLEGKIG